MRRLRRKLSKTDFRTFFILFSFAARAAKGRTSRVNQAWESPCGAVRCKLLLSMGRNMGGAQGRQ
jgi:hypothetical protein